MGVEQLQAFQEESQYPGDLYHASGNRRGQRNSVKFKDTVRKKPTNLRRANAARLRVGGIEPEVVREDETGGFKDAEQFAADILSNIRIQD